MFEAEGLDDLGWGGDPVVSPVVVGIKDEENARVGNVTRPADALDPRFQSRHVFGNRQRGDFRLQGDVIVEVAHHYQVGTVLLA